MSLFTPIKVPVKVYRWDDTGAPVLDKAAGCMMSIFKACLVTGYGAKVGAGWAMPYEDLTAKVKVFRPTLSPDADFYLRCSADNGTQMTSQVYLDMTAQNKGTLKLQCASAFKYAKKNSTGKWLLVASPLGFWFFCDQSYDVNPSKTGAHFFIGTVAGNTDSAIYMHHTGGTFDDGDYSGLLGLPNKSPGSYVAGGLLKNGVVTKPDPSTWANGYDSITSAELSLGVFIFNGTEVYQLPALSVPLHGIDASNNYAVKHLGSELDGREVISHASGGGAGSQSSSMLYIATDYWVY